MDALLFGGISPEREVSLVSGAAVKAALTRLGRKPLCVDPYEDGDWLNTLCENRVTRVFNILHGGGGEDGSVRAALSSVGIACTGSGVVGSVLAMNKHEAKQVWRRAGVPTPAWCLAGKAQDTPAAEAARILDELSVPLFVKPACGGSSTRTHVARDAESLAAAIADAALEGRGVLVEEMIEGGEYTLSIVKDEPLPMIRIDADGGYYDYDAKYVSEATNLVCPCGLPKDDEKRFADTAMRAFQALHCRDWGRVDFLLGADGEPRFLEVNTVPGMTSHSLVPLAAKTAGMDFDALVGCILDGATVEAL